MNTEMEKLHRVLIKMLDFIYSVCEEHELTCFLVYGTALGAYRHNGFIPWDDDMDLAMPRQDYETFLRIMKSREHDLYEIQDEDNEEKYFLSFAKLRKKGTVYIEKYIGDYYTHQGIFVDIFPLDCVEKVKAPFFRLKSACICYLKHILRFQAYRQLYRIKRTKIQYILDSIISFPAVWIPQRVLLKRLNKLRMGRTSGKHPAYLAEYDCGSTSVRILPYAYYFPPREITFEGRVCYVPNRIEEYLTLLYGESYMQLPPEKKQKPDKHLVLKF